MPSLLARNWIYVGLAALIAVIAARVSTPASYPLYLVLVEAGTLLAVCAVPAFAVQRWSRTPRAAHVWTLLVVLVVTFGRWYTAPPTV